MEGGGARPESNSANHRAGDSAPAPASKTRSQRQARRPTWRPGPGQLSLGCPTPTPPSGEPCSQGLGPGQMGLLLRGPQRAVRRNVQGRGAPSEEREAGSDLHFTAKLNEPGLGFFHTENGDVGGCGFLCLSPCSSWLPTSPAPLGPARSDHSQPCGSGAPRLRGAWSQGSSVYPNGAHTWSATAATGRFQQ